MKQAAYIAEVQSRSQHQKALHHIVEMLQERCRDDKLLDDILTVHKNAESGLGEEEHDDYHCAASIASPPRVQSQTSPSRPGSRKSLSSRLFSYFVSSGDDYDENNDNVDGDGGNNDDGKCVNDDQHSTEIQTPLMGKGLLGLQTLDGAYSEA